MNREKPKYTAAGTERSVQTDSMTETVQIKSIGTLILYLVNQGKIETGAAINAIILLR